MQTFADRVEPVRSRYSPPRLDQLGFVLQERCHEPDDLLAGIFLQIVAGVFDQVEPPFGTISAMAGPASGLNAMSLF